MCLLYVHIISVTVMSGSRPTVTAFMLLSSSLQTHHSTNMQDSVLFCFAFLPCSEYPFLLLLLLFSSELLLQYLRRKKRLPRGVWIIYKKWLNLIWLSNSSRTERKMKRTFKKSFFAFISTSYSPAQLLSEIQHRMLISHYHEFLWTCFFSRRSYAVTLIVSPIYH